MTINANAKIEVLAKNSREGENSQKFYNLAIMVNGEAGNISCTEDVYNMVTERAENNLVFAYNDKYKSFRAVSVIFGGAESRTDSKPDAKGK